MINDRLSEEIEAGAKMRPQFKTSVVTTDGGWEVRNSRWAYPKHQFEFDLMPGLPDTDDVLQEFLNLFYAAGGMAEAFLFRHWRDYTATGELIGEGSGSTTIFQLVKNYTRGSITRTRKITRPVAGTVRIYKSGIEQLSGWSVDTSTGLVTFSSPPAGGQPITADFEFDIPVRFADDEIEILAHTGEIEQPVGITLLEVKE